MIPRRGLVWLAPVLLLVAACQSSSPPPVVYRPPSPPPPVDEGPSSAETLTPGTRTFGSVCGTSLARWYRFTLPRETNVTLVLDSDPTTGDVDLLLFDERILSQSSIDAMAASRSGTADERIERTIRPGTYYVGVQCFDNDGPVAYSFDVVVPVVVPKDEPRSQAVLLKESSKGWIGAGQRWLNRWYRIQVEERSKLTVNFRPGMTRGLLRFEVQTPKAKVLANTTGSSIPQTLTVDLRPGEYYLRLQPEGVGATGFFDFSFVLGPSEEAQVEARRADEKRRDEERRHQEALAKQREEQRKRKEAERAEQQEREEEAAQKARERAAKRVEAPRSSARSISPGSVSVNLGSPEPIAKWYAVTVKKKGKIHVRCSGDAPLVVEVFRRGSDQVVASGLSVQVPVTVGTYDIRVMTPADTARASLDVRVHERDDDATFEEVDPSKSRDQGR